MREKGLKYFSKVAKSGHSVPKEPPILNLYRNSCNSLKRENKQPRPNIVPHEWWAQLDKHWKYKIRQKMLLGSVLK